MLIDLNPDDGGVLIVGTADELEDFYDTLDDAIKDGEGVGLILTDEAVETLTIRRLEDPTDG